MSTLKKADLKKATDSELIADYIRAFATACLNESKGLPTKAWNNHLADLNKEMLKRSLLTEEQIKSFYYY